MNRIVTRKWSTTGEWDYSTTIECTPARLDPLSSSRAMSQTMLATCLSPHPLAAGPSSRAAPASPVPCAQGPTPAPTSSSSSSSSSTWSVSSSALSACYVPTPGQSPSSPCVQFLPPQLPPLPSSLQATSVPPAKIITPMDTSTHSQCAPPSMAHSSGTSLGHAILLPPHPLGLCEYAGNAGTHDACEPSLLSQESAASASRSPSDGDRSDAGAGFTITGTGAAHDPAEIGTPDDARVHVSPCPWLLSAGANADGALFQPQPMGRAGNCARLADALGIVEHDIHANAAAAATSCCMIAGAHTGGDPLTTSNSEGAQAIATAGQPIALAAEPPATNSKLEWDDAAAAQQFDLYCRCPVDRASTIHNQSAPPEHESSGPVQPPPPPPVALASATPTPPPYSLYGATQSGNCAVAFPVPRDAPEAEATRGPECLAMGPRPAAMAPPAPAQVLYPLEQPETNDSVAGNQCGSSWMFPSFTPANLANAAAASIPRNILAQLSLSLAGTQQSTHTHHHDHPVTHHHPGPLDATVNASSDLYVQQHHQPARNWIGFDAAKGHIGPEHAPLPLEIPPVAAVTCVPSAQFDGVDGGGVPPVQRPTIRELLASPPSFTPIQESMVFHAIASAATTPNVDQTPTISSSQGQSRTRTSSYDVFHALQQSPAYVGLAQRRLHSDHTETGIDMRDILTDFALGSPGVSANHLYPGSPVSRTQTSLALPNAQPWHPQGAFQAPSSGHHGLPWMNSLSSVAPMAPPVGGRVFSLAHSPRLEALAGPSDLVSTPSSTPSTSSHSARFPLTPRVPTLIGSHCRTMSANSPHMSRYHASVVSPSDLMVAAAPFPPLHFASLGSDTRRFDPGRAVAATNGFDNTSSVDDSPVVWQKNRTRANSTVRARVRAERASGVSQSPVAATKKSRSKSQLLSDIADDCGSGASAICRHLERDHLGRFKKKSSHSPGLQIAQRAASAAIVSKRRESSRKDRRETSARPSKKRKASASAGLPLELPQQKQQVTTTNGSFGRTSTRIVTPPKVFHDVYAAAAAAPAQRSRVMRRMSASRVQQVSLAVDENVPPMTTKKRSTKGSTPSYSVSEKREVLAVSETNSVRAFTAFPRGGDSAAGRAITDQTPRKVAKTTLYPTPTSSVGRVGVALNGPTAGGEHTTSASGSGALRPKPSSNISSHEENRQRLTGKHSDSAISLTLSPDKSVPCSAKPAQCATHRETPRASATDALLAVHDANHSPHVQFGRNDLSQGRRSPIRPSGTASELGDLTMTGRSPLVGEATRGESDVTVPMKLLVVARRAAAKVAEKRMQSQLASKDTLMESPRVQPVPSSAPRKRRHSPCDDVSPDQPFLDSKVEEQRKDAEIEDVPAPKEPLRALSPQPSDGFGPVSLAVEKKQDQQHPRIAIVVPSSKPDAYDVSSKDELSDPPTPLATPPTSPLRKLDSDSVDAMSSLSYGLSSLPPSSSPTFSTPTMQHWRKCKSRKYKDLETVSNGVGPRVCFNCGVTHTASWRRSRLHTILEEGEDGGAFLCNPCGLYEKLHNVDRPIERLHSGEIRVMRGKRSGGVCANCGTTQTPAWRRGLNHESLCNACGLYYRTHAGSRPFRKLPALQAGESDLVDQEE